MWNVQLQPSRKCKSETEKLRGALMSDLNHEGMTNRAYNSKNSYHGLARRFANYVGLVGGLFSFLLGLLIDTIAGDGKNLSLVALGSLIFGLILDRIAAIIDRNDETREDIVRHKDTMSSFSSLENQIQSAFSVQFVGTADTASDQIISQILLARRVRNTFVNVGGSKSTFPIAHSQIVEGYKKFLSENKENIWQDIVSVNELFSPRFNEVTVSEPSYGRHTIGVLRQNMPLINFTLIAKPNESFSEVYFGWLYDESSRTSYIYRSRDVRLVETFRTYFDILWRDKTYECIDVDYSKSGREKLWRSSTVDKVGRWFIIAFKDGEIDGTGTYGLIEIEFVETKPVVSGVVYNKHFGMTSVVQPRSAVHTGNKLYCEYGDNRHNKSRIGGMFVYEFKKHSKRNIIQGFIIDDGSGSRVELLGVRLHEQHINADFTDAKTAQLIAEENQPFISELAAFYRYQGGTNPTSEQTDELPGPLPL